MVKFFQRICEWFNEKIRTTRAPVETTYPPTDSTDPIPEYRGIIALIVGHNEKAQGAVNYLGESEWSFSSRILRKVQKKLMDKGYVCHIIFRPSGVGYSAQVKAVLEKCKQLGITHAISSHFNSAGSSARGCEFLVMRGTTFTALKMADKATDLLNEKLGIKERGDDGIKRLDPGHRGSGMLDALNKAFIHSTLAEPCFGNTRTPESAAIFEKEDDYVDVLVDVAESCCNGTIEDYDMS